MIELGADGVQIASRFVATEECDASMANKEAYIQASDEDIVIIQSPVGMPGRALRNTFIKRLEQGQIPIRRCYHCIKKCSPEKIPYCITQALINEVKGNLEQGLIFCGTEVSRIREMTTVPALIQELVS